MLYCKLPLFFYQNYIFRSLVVVPSWLWVCKMGWTDGGSRCDYVLVQCAWRIMFFFFSPYRCFFIAQKIFLCWNEFLDYCKDLEETWEIYFFLSIAAGKREIWEMEEGYNPILNLTSIQTLLMHDPHFFGRRAHWASTWMMVSEGVESSSPCCTRSTPITDLNPLGFYSHVNVCSITYKWE